MFSTESIYGRDFHLWWTTKQQTCWTGSYEPLCPIPSTMLKCMRVRSSQILAVCPPIPRILQCCHFSWPTSWHSPETVIGKPTSQPNSSNHPIQPSNHPSNHPTIQPSNLPSNDLPSNAHYNGPLGPSHIKHQRRSKELATRLQQRKYEWNMTPRVLGNICWFAVGRNHLNLWELYYTHNHLRRTKTKLEGNSMDWRFFHHSIWHGPLKETIVLEVQESLK